MYVDDAPHNVDALRAEGNVVIVYDQPYNRELEGLRARSWIEVEQLVLEAFSARGVPVQEQLRGLDDPSERLHRTQHGA